jgi:membrane-bound lytic murein transglycosylase B
MKGDRLPARIASKPMHRVIRAVAVLIVLTIESSRAGAADAAFQKWLEGIWPQAQALGVSRATFEAATRDLEPDLKLPDLDLPGQPITGAAQAEFVQTPAEYLKESSFDRLATQGRKLRDQHRATLTKIEQQFGVPPGIVLAIWGRETGAVVQVDRVDLEHDLPFVIPGERPKAVRPGIHNPDSWLWIPGSPLRGAPE